jgi:hypothetical protein
MAVFDIIGSYGNGTVVDGPELTAEFENIYDAWNGTSTDKELHHKFSGANPSLIVDQLGAGPIARFRQNGVDKCVIGNDGKITNDNVIKDVFSWFIDTPTAGVDIEESKLFVVPSGTGMTLRKLEIIRHGGSHTGGQSITYQLRNFTTASDIGSGIAFSDANNAADTVYTETLSVSLTAGHVIGIKANTGSVTERQITVLMEWEQKLA